MGSDYPIHNNVHPRKRCPRLRFAGDNLKLLRSRKKIRLLIYDCGRIRYIALDEWRSNFPPLDNDTSHSTSSFTFVTTPNRTPSTHHHGLEDHTMSNFPGIGSARLLISIQRTRDAHRETENKAFYRDYNKALDDCNAQWGAYWDALDKIDMVDTCLFEDEVKDVVRDRGFIVGRDIRKRRERLNVISGIPTVVN